jgi:outer membrane protein
MMHRATLPILFAAPMLLCGAPQPPTKELAPAQTGPLRLSLKRAVEIAISPEGNANVQMADEAVFQAESRSAEARAAFLPDIEGSVGDQNLIRSLGSLGLTTIILPFGLKVPTLVGPYNVIDVRATGTETLDFSSIRRFQASRSGIRAAMAERDNTDNAVAAVAARAYLAALHAEADLEAVTADVALAKAVLTQAENQKAAGAGTGIEITRAKVQLSNEQQRELVTENQRRKARFDLLRALGLRLDADIELTDKLSYIPVDPLTIEQARAEALKSRVDFKAQQDRQETARLTASAVKFERLPSVSLFGDYGTTGQGSNTPMLPTRTYGLSVRVPVFDGGRRDARRSESASQFREQQTRTRDLRDQIELELRNALDSLDSAKGQIQVAQEGLALADNELAQARRRYEAGVTNGIEVTDAQTRIAV